MLQSASDWWWGTDQTDSKQKEQTTDETKDNENNDNDIKSETKEEESTDNDKIDIEFEKELKSITCLDTIISIFKLIDFENAIKTLLSKQFNNELTQQETDGILLLFSQIYQIGISTNSYLNIYSELKIGEIILSYFASLSHTNPSAFKCWDRWIKYRMDKDIKTQLKTVTKSNLEKFYATQANEIGYDNKGRLIWFVSTEKYDGYIDDNTQRKAVILLLQSFFWDMNKNKFDLHVLRHGISSHINLSNWTVNMIGWSTVYAIKDAMIAYPYALKDIYIFNPPMFVYLVNSVASQFFTAHSLDKFILLESEDEFFLKYASKDQTPILANGNSKITINSWMKERGYI